MSLASDPPGIYEVITSRLGPNDSLPPNVVYRINTGGALPSGADAVIMVEDTRLHSSEHDEEKEIETLAQVKPGENVRMPGTDVASGQKVMSKRDLVSASGGEIGTLAFLGLKEVSSSLTRLAFLTNRFRSQPTASLSSRSSVLGTRYSIFKHPHPQIPRSPGTLTGQVWRRR